MKFSVVTLLSLTMLGMVNTACSRSEQTPEHAKEICTGQFPMTDQGDINAVLPTDSGMHGLWNPHAFKSVCSQGEWEKLFVENRNIEASIKAGIFVPMYVHSDGSPLIHVRIARNDTKATLLANELKYVYKKSDAYLFVSTGALAVSGIEYIGRLAPMASRITPLAAGRWSVQVIELNAPHDPDGKASSGIPDMVVLVNPESSPATKYRQSVETFD